MNRIEKINAPDAPVVLVNNAGVFEPRRRESADGLEMTFAINVAAPFLLTGLLLPTLQKRKRSRVVSVSSISQGAFFLYIYIYIMVAGVVMGFYFLGGMVVGWSAPRGWIVYVRPHHNTTNQPTKHRPTYPSIKGGRIPWDDLQLAQPGAYSDGHRAYSLSKLLMAMFSLELAAKHGSTDMPVVCCDPGANTVMYIRLSHVYHK